MTTLVGLDVTGRPVLVAGGGPVAARRATALVDDGALVTVVAPALCEDLADRVQDGSIEWRDREVLESDLDGSWFVHAATGDPATNADVCRWATERRIWSVCASAVDDGTARTPATVEHGDLIVGVVSAGDPDPSLSRSVRDQLAQLLVSGAADLRSRRRRSPATSGGAAGGVGRVALVGGGPGAADLMTVRGRRLLAEAEVVVTDRLGPTSLLDELPSDVEVIDVGKAPGHHAVPQAEINRILVDQAQRGRHVVRLKGGDPFLFGRGGEEHAVLAAHGIPVEVVPGVSSALAAPAAAGIPLTHRGAAGGVHITHGHGRLDDAAVAVTVTQSATLVVLMGVANLADHCEQLLGAGADPALPVAIVERGTMADQRVTRAPLAGVVAAAAAGGVAAPAVIVVGAVAADDLLEGGP
jgi:uroporphyrin-III C-methyltransferase/precorrin-2 dehydrogenase/sirohydrochlorin ferrochelatase